VRRCIAWLAPRQVLDVKGDWATERPHVRPGGWAFQYNNAHYPDLDDTAVVVMGFDRARKELGTGPERDEAIARGREWVVGLQSSNGGWGAFDAENTYHYLNNIPFADHGALLDPPTADVSARCIGMLAQLGAQADDPEMRAALGYLRKVQEAAGSWFGRWGVNYIDGTWSALAAFNAAGIPTQDPTVRRAADWLIAIQNQDGGGWGEGCGQLQIGLSRMNRRHRERPRPPEPLLGLMAAGAVDEDAVARESAICKRLTGCLGEEHYTGGGFPRVLLRYLACEILPALGLGAVSQFEIPQFAPRCLRL
jgi:squalene-hopene/tetraprenyl-beta-curcumene cyclase